MLLVTLIRLSEKDLTEGILNMPTKRDASLKHSQHYAEVLLHADQLYEKGGIGIEKGLHFFDENRRDIEIGQQWSADHAEMDEDAATLALEFPERGANCLYLRQKPADRIRWLQKALQIAHDRGFGRAEASILGKLGLAFQEMRQFPNAIEYHVAQLKLAESLKDQEVWAEAACNLGIVYDDLNMLETAQEWYTAVLKISDKTSNPKIKERAYGNLGLVYIKQGKFSDAVNCFEHHLRLARRHGDLWSESNALTNLGIACMKLRQYDQAGGYFQESLVINKKLTDLEGEAKNWSYIGSLRNELGDLDGAVVAYQRRIELAQKMKDSRGEAIGCWNLGEVLIKKEKCKEGIELLFKCVEYEKSVGDPAWEEDWKTAQHMEEICNTQ